MSSRSEPKALEQFRHGEDRAYAHLVGFAACDLEAAEHARGVSPVLGRSASITTQADAPSDSWLALPAVIDFPSRTGLSAASPSIVVSGRLPSSPSSVTCSRSRPGSCRRSSSSAAARSRRRIACLRPVAVRRWLSSAKASCASRLTVPLCDDVRCVDHWHVDRRPMLHDPFVVDRHALAVLHQADASETAAAMTDPSPDMMRCAASAIACRPSCKSGSPSCQTR